MNETSGEFFKYRRRPSLIELKITEQNKQLGQSVYDFATQISKRCSLEVRKFLDQGRGGSVHMPESIKQKILENNYDVPRFSILDTRHASKFLQETGIQSRIANDSVLLIYNRSKPLTQFWWKGHVNKGGDRDARTHEMVIEWGKFQEISVNIVRNVMDRAAIKRPKFYVRRLNLIGDHPENYYYVWEVRNQPFPEVKTSFPNGLIGTKTLAQITGQHTAV